VTRVWPSSAGILLNPAARELLGGSTPAKTTLPRTSLPAGVYELNTADYAKLLNAYPVLRDLPDTLLTKLRDTAQRIEAPAGQRLFDDGSPCARFPLLVDGCVRVSKSSPDGHELRLYLLNPGESCAITAVALLGETAFPASGTADTRVTLFGLPRRVFLELIQESPAFRVFVFRFLSQRMAHLMTLVDDVAFRRVDQRLASHLLLQKELDTTTHQKLADELGTSREVVSRILESFQEAGMIRLGRKRIEILDREALDRVHQVQPQ